MSSPQALAPSRIQSQLNYLVGFFKRNNPLEAILSSIFRTIYQVLTFQSHKKLLTYKIMLEYKKMEKLHQRISEGDMYAEQGSKFMKIY